MLFNSLEFVIFFVLVLATISIIKHKKFQHLFLLGASYFFFYFSSNYLISLLIFSTVLDFYVGKEIFSSQNPKRKKILLSVSLAGNLGLLAFFKYVDFGIAQFNAIAGNLGFSEIPFLNVILPIGISFYTFQTISYTVDIYRGKLEPSKSLSEFALFVAFFPQLVAGPILRAKDFLPQLREKIDNFHNNTGLRKIIIHSSNLKLGITLMAFGFTKKMFFADNIAPLANQVFDNAIQTDSLTVILGTIAFGIQIYGDFSGYSDIAIGAALIMGFNVPKNFNKPYFATSPIDFWHRWHISLSTWLRDYLYIPLGGNKKGKNRVYLNLFLVMLLGGLWHGASWNFAIWGILHGIYLAIQKLLQNKFPILTNNSFIKSKTGKIISILITQYFIFLAWIPFRAQDTDQIFFFMQKFVFLDFAYEHFLDVLSVNKLPVILIFGFIILNYVSYKKENLYASIAKLNLKKWIVFLIGIMILILFFYDANPQEFIYFRF